MILTDLLTSFITLIVAPFYLLILRFYGNHGSIAQRLGFYPALKNKSIWLHGASLGEVNSLHSLITALQAQEPATPLVITTNTQTGYNHLKKNYPFATTGFIPLDTPPTVWCALKRLNPKKIIVAEAERWLHLFKMAHQKGIKIIAYNARMKQDSLSSPLKKLIYKNVYRHCTQILSQHIEPFKLLGLPDTVQLNLMGSPKAASVVVRRQEYKATTHKPPIPALLVGSTYPEELPYYRSLWQQLCAANKRVHLLLVSRHPSCTSALDTHTQGLKSHITHFSAATHATPQKVRDSLPTLLTQPGITTISIVGTLYDLYPYATIFYLGGTFNDIGGHNVLEPASWCLPVISGPNISSTNYEALALARTNGMQIVTTVEQLAAATIALLDNKDEYQALCAHNGSWIAAQAQN